MSKYMQIDIRLIPLYQKGFVKHFPMIASLREKGAYRTHQDKETSLYELIDYLLDITRKHGFPLNIKITIDPYMIKLSTLKETSRELLLSRNLNELDKCLYQIEAQFEDLEKIFNHC